MAGLLDRWMAVILVIAVSAFAWNLIVILPVWPMTRGFEAEWVGWALAAHQGFSFGEPYRWLFSLPPTEDIASVTSYSPTAWVDPIFPFIHAGAVWLFDDHARLAMAIFCLALFLGTAIVAAMLRQDAEIGDAFGSAPQSVFCPVYRRELQHLFPRLS